MLLFTKKKQKQKKLLFKDWLVISRNQHVEFFFPTCKFGISKGLLPKPTLFCMQLRMGVFMLHPELKECLVLWVLNRVCIFFFFLLSF